MSCMHGCSVAELASRTAWRRRWQGGGAIPVVSNTVLPHFAIIEIYQLLPAEEFFCGPVPVFLWGAGRNIRRRAKISRIRWMEMCCESQLAKDKESKTPYSRYGKRIQQILRAAVLLLLFPTEYNRNVFRKCSVVLVYRALPRRNLILILRHYEGHSKALALESTARATWTGTGLMEPGSRDWKNASILFWRGRASGATAISAEGVLFIVLVLLGGGLLRRGGGAYSLLLALVM